LLEKLQHAGNSPADAPRGWAFAASGRSTVPPGACARSPPVGTFADWVTFFLHLQITAFDGALSYVHMIACSRLNYFADCLTPLVTYMVQDL